MVGKKSQYFDAFVFFSAGPVGDQAIAVDYANRFFEASGRSAYIVSKHPNPFLSDLITPYKDHIVEIKVKGASGLFSLLKLTLQSVYMRYCYVLMQPIALPVYMKFYFRFIRFCTRSRVVGLNSLAGFYLPSGPVESATFLGKKNYIPAHVATLSFADQANTMLEFLGYKKILRPPTLTYISHPEFLSDNNLIKNQYIVFHLVSSHLYRSLPPDRWNAIIKELRRILPETIFVFSGGEGDREFIEECLDGISREHIVTLCKRTTMQELLTLYASARLSVSVHTGNAMILNMLHVPTVIVNMKGPYMFNYFFNKNAIILTSKKDCTCDPLDVKCTEVLHKGKPYMACVYNTPNEVIVENIVSLWKKLA